MTIDWTVFDQYSENTIDCRCGHVYRSHSKVVMALTPHIVTRKPCPRCGKTVNNAVRAASDPEGWTIGGASPDKTKEQP